MKANFSILKNLFAILFVGVLITSCEKDKDDPIDNLVGTWTAESADADAMIGGKTMTEYFTGLGYTAEEAQLLENLFIITLQQNFTGTITFNSDMTYIANLGGESDSGTWNLSNDNKQLTIDSSTEPPLIFNVQTLTANELRVTWTETGQEDMNDDGVPELITVDVDMTFNK